jgi:hypothetical protein
MSVHHTIVRRSFLTSIVSTLSCRLIVFEAELFRTSDPCAFAKQMTRSFKFEDEWGEYSA